MTPGSAPPFSSVARPTSQPVVCDKANEPVKSASRAAATRIRIRMSSFHDLPKSYTAARRSRDTATVVNTANRCGRFCREFSCEPKGPVRLHIGSGTESLPGWINIDNKGLSGVDLVLDVRHGLPFRNVEAIYAEHFLEHLGARRGLRLPLGVPPRLERRGRAAALDAQPGLGHATHYHGRERGVRRRGDE